MAKAIIFSGSTLYSNVRRMLDGLRRGLSHHGVSCIDIDTSQANHQAKLRQHMDEGNISFFLSMSGLGLDRSTTDNLFNRSDAPFISYYLDPLILYADHISVPITPRLVATISDCDIAYWREAAPDVHFHHLPHAAQEGDVAEWESRDIEFLFPATGCDDPCHARQSWSQHGAAVESTLNDIVDEHLLDPLRPLTDSVRAVLGGRIDFTNPLAVHPYFSTIDKYLRMERRWSTLSALKDLPITVAGSGWEAFQSRHEDHNMNFVGACDALHVQSLMQKSRAVINTCTGYHGSHERVFDAQAAGAVAITSPTRWFRSSAPEAGIIYLDHQHGELHEQVRAHAQDPANLADIAARGRAWQNEHHTWHTRGGEILDWLQTYS